MKAKQKFTANEIYALAFGLFLGLCIWKFGNPVIFDQQILPPSSFSEFWNDAWPPHWVNRFFVPFVIVGGLLFFKNYSGANSQKTKIGNQKKWLWLLPLLWFGWQLISATQTVDADLTSTTLCQFFGCVVCYFLGAFLFQNFQARNLLLIGILAAFVFCLIRATDQKFVEFPQSEQVLVEGQRDHWTNLPPKMVLEMKYEQAIITTNGADVVNPVMLAKFAEDRVMGTMVYPNALAGIILLLLPVSLTLAFSKKLRPKIRAVVIALTIFLGFGGLFWSGSKGGWLIAMGIGGIYLLRLRWPIKFKIAAIVIVAVLGLGIFAVRFHHYFAKGATSVVARFDYWRAAVQTTAANPMLGTGPGTFQRPYAKIKSPNAEMSRLTHNDYLEQFSDSGIPGGIFYASWIFLALAIVGKQIWKNGNAISFAIFAGLLGWFIQGFAEFGLYIPAVAWTAFVLLGCLIGNQFDKNRQIANLKAK